MKTVIIIIAVLVLILALTIIGFSLYIKSLNKKREKEMKELADYFTHEIEEIKKQNLEKDKLKVEYDKKEDKVDTGNPYLDYINGATELQNSSKKRAGNK